MSDKKVWDFLPEFVTSLQKQLEDDDERWGDTWLKRTRYGQEDRTIATFNDYFDKWIAKKTPIPWMKIVGGALICWIREQHPEIWGK
jgi:hypothetical protein